jgi:menaquinone-dependent protoporphyrinogen IX oxidase
VNALVVYFSKYGNTKKIADAVVNGLRSGTSVRMMELIQLTAPDFEGVDLLVMGSPTHRMNLPEEVRSVFERFPKKILRGMAVAAFDTSYRMSDRNSPEWLAKHTAASKLAKRLRKLGGKHIAAPASFHVQDCEGPLYEGEIERAEAWAISMLRHLESNRE